MNSTGNTVDGSVNTGDVGDNGLASVAVADDASVNDAPAIGNDNDVANDDSDELFPHLNPPASR